MAVVFRHKLQVAIIIALIFFACAATSDVWIAWAMLAGLAVVLLSVDCLFFDESAFIYDPNYKNWARRTGPQY